MKLVVYWSSKTTVEVDDDALHEANRHIPYTSEAWEELLEQFAAEALRARLGDLPDTEAYWHNLLVDVVRPPSEELTEEQSRRQIEEFFGRLKPIPKPKPGS
jgi:hypothetical protein